MKTEIFSNNSIILEAVKHYIRFMKWDIKISHQQIRSTIEKAEADFFIVGEIENNLDIPLTIQRIRKKNPLQPIIMLSHVLTPEDEHACHKADPVLVCKWPFNSLNFVQQISFAKEKVAAAQKAVKVLNKIHDCLLTRKPREALALVQKIKNNIAPSLFEVLVARAFLVGNALPKALQHAKMALKHDPKSTEAIEVVARILNKMGKRSEAMNTLQSRHSIIAHDVDCMLLLADLHLEDGNLNDSKAHYGKAKVLDPRNIAAKKGEFIVGVMDGSIKAVKSTKNETETSMEVAKLCNSKAIALVEAKQYSLAETLYRNTIKLLPDKRVEYKLWMNLGLCMKKAKQWDKALEFFQTGQRKSPQGYDRFKEQIKSIQQLKRKYGG